MTREPRRWLAAALLPALTTGALQAQGPTLVVTGATLWDGTGAPARPATSVVVRDGRIACIGSATQCPAPAGATRIDAAGRYLLPGLIDTHVHLLLRVNGVTDTAIKADLHDLLARGITTLRDMGNNPSQLLIAVDSAQPAPRVFAMQLVAGIRFFAPEAERMEDGHFRNHAPAATGMRQLGWWPIMFAPKGNAEEVVKEALNAGAIGLKLYQDLDTLQIARLVRAAHAAGLPVWGHAWVQPSSVSEQSRAGQDGVVHAAGLVGDLLDAGARDTFRTSSDLLLITADSASPESATHPGVLAALDTLRARGTFLEPTLQAELLSAVRARASHRRLTLPQRYALAGSGFGIEVTRQAVKRGVRLTAGTDHVAYGPAEERAQLADELALYVDSVGLSPGQALLAATRDAAVALGPMGRDLGTVEVGKRADLVLLTADPLADIRNVTRVEWVMKEGTLYRPEALRGLATP
ncbi:MAG TPA: amidohydrolase family protein [Gemmatimonadales bacterium]|nr:amidohydrolase family protein [Gemmatimonadales bacterium]